MSINIHLFRIKQRSKPKCENIVTLVVMSIQCLFIVKKDTQHKSPCFYRLLIAAVQINT